MDRAKVEQSIRELLATWVATQNRGDFAAYTALYEQGHFRGLKRSKSGKATRADWVAWREDRGKMFGRGPMTVAVEDVTIQTWLDAGTSLRPGISEARFVQRWRNPRYADHGVKVLQFLWTKNGIAILYEDMLTSSPGWEDVPASDGGVEFALGSDVAVPKTDDEALALWRKLAITESTVREATSMLEDFAGANLMAEALLRQGKLVCKRFVDYGECGQTRLEWEPIPPETGWDDPCVQRDAAAWAIGRIPEKRLSALSEVLIKLASLPPPEDQIPSALVERFGDMPERLRLQVVRAMLAARCDEEGCDGWKPESNVTALSVKSRVALYQDRQLAVAAREAAIEGVDLSQMPDVLAEVYSDGDLRVPVREKLWDTLAAQKPAVVERALRLAAKDEGCAFAMAAIERLAKRGKRDLLPRAGRDDSARVVCLLLNATDKKWAEREFDKLLPKRGEISFTEESEDETDPEHGGKQSSEESVPASQVGLQSLPRLAGEHIGKVEGWELDHAATVELYFDEHGLLSGVWKSTWIGCPC